MNEVLQKVSEMKRGFFNPDVRYYGHVSYIDKERIHFLIRDLGVFETTSTNWSFQSSKLVHLAVAALGVRYIELLSKNSAVIIYTANIATFKNVLMEFSEHDKGLYVDLEKFHKV